MNYVRETPFNLRLSRLTLCARSLPNSIPDLANAVRIIHSLNAQGIIATLSMAATLLAVRAQRLSPTRFLARVLLHAYTSKPNTTGICNEMLTVCCGGIGAMLLRKFMRMLYLVSKKTYLVAAYHTVSSFDACGTKSILLGIDHVLCNVIPYRH